MLGKGKVGKSLAVPLNALGVFFSSHWHPIGIPTLWLVLSPILAQSI